MDAIELVALRHGTGCYCDICLARDGSLAALARVVTGLYED